MYLQAPHEAPSPTESGILLSPVSDDDCVHTVIHSPSALGVSWECTLYMTKGGRPQDHEAIDVLLYCYLDLDGIT